MKYEFLISFLCVPTKYSNSLLLVLLKCILMYFSSCNLSLALKRAHGNQKYMKRTVFDIFLIYDGKSCNAPCA